MSTQSASESTVPSLTTPDSHEHQSESAIFGLTIDHTTCDLFVDALLHKFDTVSNKSNDEYRPLQADLENV